MVVGAHDAGPLTYKHGGVVGLYVITICLYVIVTSRCLYVYYHFCIVIVFPLFHFSVVHHN